MFFLNRNQIAKVLGVSRAKVDKLIKDGEFESFTPSRKGSHSYSGRDVFEWMVQCESAKMMAGTVDEEELSTAQKKDFHQTRRIRAKINKLMSGKTPMADVEDAVVEMEMVFEAIDSEFTRILDKLELDVFPRSNLDSRFNAVYAEVIDNLGFLKDKE